MSGSVSPETAAAFAQQMTAHGLDPAPALARFGLGSDGQPAQALQPGAAGGDAGQQQPDARARIAVGGHGSVTPAEAERAANHLAKVWTGDAAVLRTALENMGFTEADTDADTRAAAQRKIDEGFRSGNPGEYQLGGAYADAKMPPAELVKFDAGMRETLAALNFPVVAAKSFVEDVVRAAGPRGYNAQPSDPAKQMFSDAEIRGAVTASGATSREDFFATARGAAARIPAKVRDDMIARGAFEDRRVLTALYQAGQRLQAYRKD